MEKIVTKDLSAPTIGKILFAKTGEHASTKEDQITPLTVIVYCTKSREMIMNCCRQIGAKAMTCECTDDYVGRNCEIHLLNTMEGKYSDTIISQELQDRLIILISNEIP